jgi:hypothetical protein
MSAEQMASSFGAELADSIACMAHEEWFSDRQGVCDLGAGIFAFYNNHPFRNAPLLRDQMMAEIGQALDANGFVTLATARYPTTGPSAGYTMVLVVKGPGPVDEVLLAKQNAVDNAFRILLLSDNAGASVDQKTSNPNRKDK